MRDVRKRRTDSTLIQRIVDATLVRIEARHLTVGDKVTSVREIQYGFDCSVATAVEAMRDMKDAGILEARRGNNGGYFLKDPPPRRGVHINEAESWIDDARIAIMRAGGAKPGAPAALVRALESLDRAFDLTHDLAQREARGELKWVR